MVIVGGRPPLVAMWFGRVSLGVAPLLVASTSLLAACSSTGTRATSTTLAAGPDLVVCTDVPYEPFEYGDEDLTGFDVELVETVAARLERTARFTPTPLDQFEAALASNSCELVASALPIPAPGTSTLLFSSPYLEVGQALLVRADDTSTLPGFGSTAGRQVGVVTDSPSADFAAGALPPDAAVVGFATIEEAVDALRAGTVDAVIGDAPVLGHVVLEDDGVVVTDSAATDVSYGLAVGPPGTELLASVDAALAELEADGTLPELRRSWFGSG